MDRSASTSYTAHLARTELFQPNSDDLPVEQRIDISYRRAQAIARAYNLTAHDVQTLSDKFWAMHADNIAACDVAPMALLTIQYNLAAGTIAPWAAQRPELRKPLQRILDFDVSGQFMLTEHAHGLDAIHLETTATLLPDGSFDLHTPHDGAAKYMPPSVPLPDVNLARIAVVIARLIVNGEDFGIRPFVAPLSTGKQMCKGVTAKLLPERAGAGPLGHSLTYFNHVKLHPSACLGPLTKPKNPKIAFQAAIWRITIGGLALGALAIPTIAVSSYLTARYSMRRTVYSAADGVLTPVIDFRTQQIPILHGLAQSFVMAAFMCPTSSYLKKFCDPNFDGRVRMGIANAAKIVMMMHIQQSTTELSDRVGAQGLFCYNQIIAHQLEMRGASIAEGDVLLLGIRLATELIIGRYALPPPLVPSSLAARHEVGILTELRDLYNTKIGGKHRSELFNRLILPQCKSLVEAVGHRLFYDAGVEAGLDQGILDIYEAGVIKHDRAWFAVNAGMSVQDQIQKEDVAINAVLPSLERWLQMSGSADYALAPILTQKSWDEFTTTFKKYSGNGDTQVIGGASQVGDSDRTEVVLSAAGVSGRKISLVGLLVNLALESEKYV